MNTSSKKRKIWKIFRRLLVGIAIFATLAAIFYTEENWRGKRAWLKCKAELEAKGVVLDWDKFIPPPVPDDQNFFTVNTNFYLRFVKLQTEEQRDAASRVQWLNLTNGFPILDLEKLKPVVAEIIVAMPMSAASSSGINLRDPDAASKLQAALRSAVGRDANGSAGFKFTEFQLTNLVPAKITLLSDSIPTVGEMEKLIPPMLFTNIGKLAVSATVDPNIFQVRFADGRVTSAAEYLTWGNAHYAADLDEVRAALKRPYAIIPGDYSVPYQRPIQNFITLRALAQTLAQRAQCDFLLGRPEDALREVTLMHDMCRILEKPPVGKPITLVEAMINVAISGLYTATVADGFRLNAWHEPQIAALQKQFKEINLPLTVRDSFASEHAASVCTIEKTPAAKIAELFNMVDVASGKQKNKSNFWKHLNDPMYLFFRLCPRGWVYQNMVNVVSYPRSEDAVDLENGTLSPQVIDQAMKDSEKSGNRVTPFNVWSRIMIPNFNKVWQATVHNQTLADQGQIVCALERYKLANAHYPEMLEMLAPRFIETIPHDIIGGQPLHYRRTDDGKFLLYSIGWNETDDGGLPGTLADGKKGDWVWEN